MRVRARGRVRARARVRARVRVRVRVGVRGRGRGRVRVRVRVRAGVRVRVRVKLLVLGVAQLDHGCADVGVLELGHARRLVGERGAILLRQRLLLALQLRLHLSSGDHR